MKAMLLILALACLGNLSATAQSDEDALQVRAIYDEVLTKAKCHDWLRYICKSIGARPCGSAAMAAAEKYTMQMLKEAGADTVWLQAVAVPHWVRGEVAQAKVLQTKSMGDVELTITALGGSGPTPKLGLSAELVMVNSIEDLQALGEAAVKGKIVFFNRPMDDKLVSTFQAYGRAADQRGSGPNEAAKLGAVGAIVRSMTLKRDDFPHSGGTVFGENVPRIPSVAVSYVDADLLAAIVDSEGKVRLHLRLDSRMETDRIDHNVIADIKGSRYPEEIILVGGHLDSWDLAEGAHDDGTGCVQAMEVLRTFKAMGFKPQRTIRCVLFANEEFGMRGAIRYFEYAKELDSLKIAYHLAAIESDGGGHTPRGFSYDGLPDVVKKRSPLMTEWRSLLAPYGLHDLQPGGSGADIYRLRDLNTWVIGFTPDSQRYFDFHHAATDVFENVHRRELELGAAAMASLVYLLDKHLQR